MCLAVVAKPGIDCLWGDSSAGYHGGLCWIRHVFCVVEEVVEEEGNVVLEEVVVVVPVCAKMGVPFAVMNWVSRLRLVSSAPCAFPLRDRASLWGLVLWSTVPTWLWLTFTVRLLLLPDIVWESVLTRMTISCSGLRAVAVERAAAL